MLLDEIEKKPSAPGIPTRVISYLAYAAACLLSYFSITIFTGLENGIRLDAFFFVIAVWGLLSAILGGVLFPIKRFSALGLGLLLLLASLFLANLILVPIFQDDWTLRQIQTLFFACYFTTFFIVAELLLWRFRSSNVGFSRR